MRRFGNYSRGLIAALFMCVLACAVASAQTPVADEGAANRSPELLMTGEAPSEVQPFDRLLRTFVVENNISAAALAVVREGRLVLARGYSRSADPAREPVQPTSLFRIASISKPITAVAVLQLVEQGNLSLDEKVFNLLDLGSGLSAEAQVDPRLREVTIGQLLRHTAGFDRQKSFDPMFRSVEIAESLGVPPPAGPEHVIRHMTTRPLDFDPGARYAYSNFGYCLLGRVIEKVTGEGYEQAVQARVLAPLQIRTMRIGKTLPEGRAEHEVSYDGSIVPRLAVIGKVGEWAPAPYGGWYLEAMDSHGGWIASAVDLVRFARALDDVERCPLLKPESIRGMWTRPEGAAGFEADGSEKSTFYGYGWFVRPGKDAAPFACWHTGSLDGTATLLVHRADRTSWAVLFNRRSGPKHEHFGQAIDPLLQSAAAEVEAWPEVDLFTKYESQ
ncbi:MAG: beta-lactamase family protein [Planctomycetes bacterium]|nr:beta-lactamase family protein [Planctomycetota bacterium]